MLKHPIDSITVHEPARVQNLTIFPVSLSQTTGPEYITTAQTTELEGLVIKEISEDGSVPDLLVLNTSEHMILLLDGEELRGAKQNRIVNTTLLLAPFSTTEIPVSCTERGRWHYTSNTFAPGKSVMPSKARRRKTRAVSESLQAGCHFMPDQTEVWADVEELHDKVGSDSPTRAMADAYESMRQELEAAVEALPPLDGQTGLIAMINGEPAGMDLLSRPEAYQSLHAQILQSYAMEALTNRKEAPQPDVLAAKAFLERCAAIPGKSYPSVALGKDWRFVSPAIVGSGLAHERTWVHMAYFFDDADEGHRPNRRSNRMARLSQRSRYHRE